MATRSTRSETSPGTGQAGQAAQSMSWRIGGRTGLCARCERAFDEGEKHVSSLAVEADVFRREDHCVSCWGQGPAPDDSPPREGQEGGEAGGEEPDAGGGGGGKPTGDVSGPAPLFWWFTRRRADSRKGLQLDLASLEHLFLQLEGREEMQVRELRYLLCLLLMRKRRLKVVKVKRTPEGEFFHVRRPRRQESFAVQVYDFTAERMAELRGQLQVVFEGLDPEGGILTADLGFRDEGGDGTGENTPDTSDT